MACSDENQDHWPVVAVVDGQGGGIGSAIIKGLREQVGEKVAVLALGTNASATTAMMRAGANRGATGENAIVRSVAEADLIVGNMVIVMAHAMMGELTPRMAEAIAGAPAQKWLLPLATAGVELIGVEKRPLPHLIRLVCETLSPQRREAGSPSRRSDLPRAGSRPKESGGGDV